MPNAENQEQQAAAEQLWREYMLHGTTEAERRRRRLYRILPSNPRCKNCYAPFRGIGGFITKSFFGKQRSRMNPKLCNVCEQYASKYQGGAEIELSLLFADVRGSTSLAEKMNPTEFSRLINRFYNTASQVMISSDALIDKIIGDQVAGIYAPGFAGQNHARRAIETAQELLAATGHLDSHGPWIPLGVGVHTGIAYIGSVGSEDGTSDITVLGDTPNTAARLSSSAGIGEILISEAALTASGMDLGGLEKRQLTLKGKSLPIEVHVLTGRKIASSLRSSQ